MSSNLCQPEMSEQISFPGVPDIVAQPSGVLSNDPAANPSFHDWNHVYLWYCSSDSFLGDAAWGAIPPAGGDDPPEGVLGKPLKWEYRGRRIAEAVVKVRI